jgi:hypothetical protein
MQQVKVTPQRSHVQNPQAASILMDKTWQHHALYTKHHPLRRLGHLDKVSGTNVLCSRNPVTYMQSMHNLSKEKTQFQVMKMADLITSRLASFKKNQACCYIPTVQCTHNQLWVFRYCRACSFTDLPKHQINQRLEGSTPLANTSHAYSGPCFLQKSITF